VEGLFQASPGLVTAWTFLGCFFEVLVRSGNCSRQFGIDNAILSLEKIKLVHECFREMREILRLSSPLTDCDDSFRSINYIAKNCK
jgi:hypothetical protein